MTGNRECGRSRIKAFARLAGGTETGKSKEQTTWM